MAPLRKQALTDISAQRQAQTEGLQQANITERDLRRASSLAAFANSIKPDIDAGNLPGVIAATQRRISDLDARAQAGEQVDSREARQFLDVLQNNPSQAPQLVNQAIAVGQQLSRGATATPKASAPTIDPATGKSFQTVFDPSTGKSISQPVVGAPLQETPTQKREAAVIQQQEIEDIKTAGAGKRKTAELKASRTSEITKELSTRNREAARNGRTLKQALTLAQQADQGLKGSAKLKLARLLPGIDVTDEGALDSTLLQLAIDQLQQFKGPTTDFEFGVVQSITGAIGESKTANVARIKSLERATWFNKREFEQFKRHTRSGGDPDEFRFNFGEPVKTKKGVFTLQDLQDTAVQNNLTIEEVLKEFNK